jgi:Mg/Co/Ni transporter MgtE
MLNLTASERQSLAGPLVVGCVLGAIVSLASWGFDSKYGRIDSWRMMVNALGAFLAAIVVATVPLGILPIAIHRHPSPASAERLDSRRVKTIRLMPAKSGRP